MLAPSLCTRVRLHRAWYVASMTRARSSGHPSSSPFSHLLRGRFDRKAVPWASSFPQSRSHESHRKLGATGELLQGPAIAIRITKIGKRPPILHIDLTDVNASFDQVLAHAFHVRDHHKKPFERSGLHGGDAHPNHDGAGRTGRGQLDKAQVLPDLLVKISVKADLLRIKSLGAVNVCNRYRNQFEFHLHGSHGCFPLSLCLTILLLQVYPERRTESILLSANMLEEVRARRDEGISVKILHGHVGVLQTNLRTVKASDTLRPPQWRSFWQDTSNHSAENSPFLVKNSTDKAGYRSSLILMVVFASLP